jgi:hypothetical protein
MPTCAPRVDPFSALRSLLLSAPGEALCEACLALACAVSLVEMRALTEVLTQTEPEFRRAATCASCRRMVPSTVWK